MGVWPKSTIHPDVLKTYKRRWVFDLDNTLVYTHTAVIQAYKAAGVIMPPEAWGRPWREWTTQDVHDRKCKLYPHILKRYAWTDELFLHAMSMYAPVITGASEAAVIALRELFGELNVQLMEATRLDKVNWLNEHPVGIYVDDDEGTRALVKEGTSWEVMTPAQALQQLSSQPEKTSG